VTGIDISGEKPGLLPTPEWKKTAFKRARGSNLVSRRDDQLWSGSGLFARHALQLAHVASVIAGRGTNFRPRLVIGLRDASGKVKPIAPIPGKRIEGVSDADWDA